MITRKEPLKAENPDCILTNSAKSDENEVIVSVTPTENQAQSPVLA